MTATHKGWSAATLERLGVRLENGRYVFELQADDGTPVGAVRYSANGQKPKILADRGSVRELWPRPETIAGEILLSVEGEPDAVSTSELGFPAVSYPGVGKTSPEWPRRLIFGPNGRRERIVFIPDCDKVGRRRARELAQQIDALGVPAYVADLAPDRDDGYDVGDALIDLGPTLARQLVERAIEHAEPVRAPVSAVAPDETAEALRERLEKRLGLDTVDAPILRAKVTGQGASARVQIWLPCGELEFATAREMVRPQSLVAELAAVAGVAPKLTQAQCAEALVLVRAIATHVETVSADDEARTWGLEYLQAAEKFDLDIYDAEQRFAAFKRLDAVNPAAAAKQNSKTIAQSSVVLRHLDGGYWVRTGWFRAYVRQEQDPTISPPQLALRMESVGWNRRGKRGAIWAGNDGEELVQAFYDVPRGWDEPDD